MSESERCTSTCAFGQLACSLRAGHDDWHMELDYDDDNRQFIAAEWADEDADEVGDPRVGVRAAAGEETKP